MPAHVHIGSSARAVMNQRNQHPHVKFDDIVKLECYFEAVMPANYNGADITVYIHSAAETDTSANWYYRAAFEKVDGLDIDGDSFDNEFGEVITVSATSGIITVESESVGSLDDIAAGDAFRLKVWRDPENISDVVSDAIELYAMELREN